MINIIMSQTPFLKIFGLSPFKLLEKHMKVAYSVVNELEPFMACIKKEDWEGAKLVQEKIVDLENKADAIKKETRAHLPKSLFLPVSRSDLLSLINAQDSIPNVIKDITGLLLGRHMSIPNALQESFDHFVARSIAACLQIKDAIYELDGLVESGFGRNEVKIIEKMIKNLDEIETETDHLQIEVRQKLFSIEKTLPPIDVMFLYQVIGLIGRLADSAHYIGGQLLILLSR